MKREIKEEVGHYIGPFIARKQSGEYFFQPISAFDNLIPRFAELGNPISNFKPTGRNARECLDSLEGNATLIAHAKEMNKLATSEALKLPLKNNLAFPLYSPKVFSNSASISHITPSELYTHDFLMTPNAFAKLKVSDAMQAFGSIYGPRTMGVLTLMGYSSVQSISNPLKLKYIDIYEQVPVKLKYDGSIDRTFKKPKGKLKKSNSM